MLILFWLVFCIDVVAHECPFWMILQKRYAWRERERESYFFVPSQWWWLPVDWYCFLSWSLRLAWAIAFDLGKDFNESVSARDPFPFPCKSVAGCHYNLLPRFWNPLLHQFPRNINQPSEVVKNYRCSVSQKLDFGYCWNICRKHKKMAG